MTYLTCVVADAKHIADRGGQQLPLMTEAKDLSGLGQEAGDHTPAIVTVSQPKLPHPLGCLTEVVPCSEIKASIILDRVAA